jgi:hypothetical protein
MDRQSSLGKEGKRMGEEFRQRAKELLARQRLERELYDSREPGDPKEPVMVDRDEFLSHMGLAARIDARDRLSADGEEVLRMLDTAMSSGLGAIEAVEESKAFKGLNDDDQAVLDIYLARVTMLDWYENYEPE